MNKTLLAIAALAAASCFHVRYVTEVPPQPAPALDEWHHNFFAGLWEASGPVDVSSVCPEGFAVVDNQVGFLNWLASTLVQSAAEGVVNRAEVASGGQGNVSYYTSPFSINFQIWSPSWVQVYCVQSGPPPFAPPAVR